MPSIRCRLSGHGTRGADVSPADRPQRTSRQIFRELLSDCAGHEPGALEDHAKRGDLDDEQGTGSSRGSRRLVGTGVAAVIAGLFVVLLVYGLISRSTDTTIDDSLARHQVVAAPPFRLATLQRGALGSALTPKLTGVLADGQVSRSELLGIPYVLNFWASWCDACRQEAPRLESRWRQAKRSGVLFVGLDMQDVTEDARRFMGGFGVGYLNIRDPSDDVARRYGVTGLPETYFISRRGEIVGHVVGVVTASDLQDGIAAARAGRALPARQGGARKPTA